MGCVAVNDQLNPTPLLARIGFDPEASILTRRQAEVLVLREEGHAQADIAATLGTSRANVSSVEASARENVRKAHETVAFAQALQAPVQMMLEVGTDLHDVPRMVYTACDESGVNMNRTAPELIELVTDGASKAIRDQKITEALVIGVTGDGTIQVRTNKQVDP
jgi:Tfx family DNA-binding protein